MEAHTARPKHSLGLNKMLGEKKVPAQWERAGPQLL
jgi:hypothetical protein